MRISHYITIAVALALVAVFYWGVNTVPSKSKSPKSNGKPSVEEVMAMQQSHAATPASFDSIYNAAKKNLPTHAQEEIAALEKTIQSKNDSASMALEMEQLAKVWQEHKEWPVAAYYYMQAGKLVNSEKKLTFAAQLFLALARKAHSESVQAWEGAMAIEGFKRVLEMNPNNDSATVSLAECYIGTGQTMQGVFLLRDFSIKNPDNVPANLLLGQQDIVSGQLEKAIGRFSKVLQVEPDNLEAMMGLAEVYKNKGDKAKAIELFERAKKTMNNPEFSKDIDNYIKSF